MNKRKTIILCILDGWGITNNSDSNAIKQAATPNYDFLLKNFPSSQLKAHGECVGLLPNQMGNSEVGHTTIGAGRVMPMNLTKIDEAIKTGSLQKNDVVRKFVLSLKKSGGVAHLAGCFSSGGVHSHKDHIIYLANIIAGQGIRVKLHLFLDGRDVPPKTAESDIKWLETVLDQRVSVATIVGRFFSMDRDNRWDRVEKAYRLLAEGIGEHHSTALDAILSRYSLGETDEFIKASVIGDYEGFSTDTDGLFFMNFRSDRACELLSALCDPNFNKFHRHKNFKLISQCGLIEYSNEHVGFMKSVLTRELIDNTLGEILSLKKKMQFRLAETEKYPHVTFFFNSGIESPTDGESRFMVPSPNITTYDLKPEMSANIVTEKLVELIRSEKFDFILVNYANPDMVGHSGILEAAVKACEAVDICLGRIYSAVLASNATLLLTSDHGNCEVMYDEINKSPHTSHTLNPVPFIAVGVDELFNVRDGELSDIAPTVLDVLGLDVPQQMTGRSLLKVVEKNK